MPTRRDFVKMSSLTVSAASLAGEVGAEPDASPRFTRPNLVFVMTDQQSGDAMSCRMGRQHLHTPTMDSLAANGMLFTRAYSANPLCMPLRASLFTGRYPHETGVTKNGKPKGGVDPKEFVCMGTYFRNAGYETAYSGKWHLCFDQKDPSAHGFEILKSKAGDNYDAKVTDGAVRFLAREHKRPFLLVVSFLNPHNVCEWGRRLAGREQKLNCGEIGDPLVTELLADDVKPVPFAA